MYVTDMDRYPGAVERILDEMQKEGITRKELAQKCGVSYGNLSRILRGDYVGMTDSFRAKIVRSTGWDGLWIFYGIKREGA